MDKQNAISAAKRMSKAQIKEVAKQAGCHWRTVYNWRSGKRSFFASAIEQAIFQLKKI